MSSGFGCFITISITFQSLRQYFTVTHFKMSHYLSYTYSILQSLIFLNVLWGVLIKWNGVSGTGYSLVHFPPHISFLLAGPGRRSRFLWAEHMLFSYFFSGFVTSPGRPYNVKNTDLRPSIFFAKSCQTKLNIYVGSNCISQLKRE